VNRYRGKGLGLLESLDIGCLDGLGGLRNLSGQWSFSLSGGLGGLSGLGDLNPLVDFVMSSLKTISIILEFVLTWPAMACLAATTAWACWAAWVAWAASWAVACWAACAAAPAWAFCAALAWLAACWAMAAAPPAPLPYPLDPLPWLDPPDEDPYPPLAKPRLS
jgi:hypothetical protein